MLISKGEDITDNSWNILATQQANTSQGNICLHGKLKQRHDLAKNESLDCLSC